MVFGHIQNFVKMNEGSLILKKNSNYFFNSEQFNLWAFCQIKKFAKLKANADKVSHPKYSGPKFAHQFNLTPIVT